MVNEIRIENYSEPYGHDSEIRPANPMSKMNLKGPFIIREIFCEQSYDAGDWECGILEDGRYFVYDSWSDYTFSGEYLTLAETEEEMRLLGLSPDQRKFYDKRTRS